MEGRLRVESRAPTAGQVHRHPSIDRQASFLKMKSLPPSVISAWVIASGRFTKWSELAFLLIPAVIYLAASMAGGMNIGIHELAYS